MSLYAVPMTSHTRISCCFYYVVVTGAVVSTVSILVGMTGVVWVASDDDDSGCTLVYWFCALCVTVGAVMVVGVGLGDGRGWWWW